MEKNIIIARSVAPHYPLPTTTDSNVSDRANLSEVGYGKGEHKNTEWVPAEPENNVEEDLFCLDCNESLSLEFDDANI